MTTGQKDPIRPPTPNWFTKLNFIVGYWIQGCDVPLTVYVQFAKAPTEEVVLALVLLDLKDIVKEFFRPAGLRSGRHGRKGSRGKRPNIDLLDPSEMFAKNVPGYAEYRGRPFGSPTFWAFEITDVIDRVAWSFFCLDAVTDIGYGTLLGIITFDTSVCPNIARMQRHTFYQAILPTYGGFAGYPLEHLDFAVGVTSLNGYVADFVGSRRYAITHEIKARQTTPGHAEIAIGIYDYVAGVNVNQTEFVPNDYPGEVTLSVDAIVEGPGSVGCSIATITPGHPPPGGQHFEVIYAKWLILSLT